MLNHEKEATTLPFGKDMTGFLFFLAEQQSIGIQESYIDLLSYKYSLHTVMNLTSLVVLSFASREKMKEASRPEFNAPNDRQSTVLPGSTAGIESCAVWNKGFVVGRGSMNPGFWPYSVPCPPEGLFHGAQTTDNFHMMKISECSLTEPR